MENNYVNEQTLVGELVNQYPETIEILLGIGMHCLGCPASQMESLGEACMVHGFDPAQVVAALNKKIAENR